MLAFVILATSILPGIAYGPQEVKAEAAAAAADASILDNVTFGDAASESAHQFNALASESDTITGALGQSARRLLPIATTDGSNGFWGGRMSFTQKVDPDKQNYLTIKLWGSEAGEELGKLLLFGEGGKQVGWHTLGDVDALDITGDHVRVPGKFFYHTIPIPRPLTAGKTSATLEIHATGKLFTYAGTPDRYFHKLDRPSRGIYKVFTHTDPAFNPPAGEVIGTTPTPDTRPAPGPEIIERVKAQLNKDIANYLSSNYLAQKQMLLLAKAYRKSWSDAYQNPVVVDKILAGLDYTSQLYCTTPSVWNGGEEIWGGLGKSGYVIALMSGQIKDKLGVLIDHDADAETPMITRKEAYLRMLIGSRDYWRKGRVGYTNQTLICDLGIYQANQGIAALDSSKALPESQALRYLYEAVGVSPWLGPEDDHFIPKKPLGDHYYVTTEAGLSRELGYVGHYGEIIDFVGHALEGTMLDNPEGDPRSRPFSRD